MRGHLDGSSLKRSERGSWRCIWAELKETQGKERKDGGDRDEEGDPKESKCAKTKQGGYEDARGG